MTRSKIPFVKRYLAALEAGAVGDGLAGDEIARQRNYDCFEPW